MLYRDSSQFYGGKNYGAVYACLPCDARVGCHHGTVTPLGRLANAELRAAKMRAHDAFDPLWRRKAKRYGMNRHEARSRGYEWLAACLGIPVEKCHIGMFDVATCDRVVELVRRTTRRPDAPGANQGAARQG